MHAELTPELTQLAYSCMLCRESESEKVVQENVQNLATMQVLIPNLKQLGEYAARELARTLLALNVVSPDKRSSVCRIAVPEAAAIQSRNAVRETALPLSVIVPVRQGERFRSTAIDSILGQMP
ncbi:MAG: hypothetical protein JWM36_2825 [Hyphomicrobiales bacterium]|nr:hypothetical protein [Hyphomicrobiales bacterium]